MNEIQKAVARHMPKVLSLIAGIVLMIGGVYLVATGRTVEGAGVLAGAVGTLALPRVGERS